MFITQLSLAGSGCFSFIRHTTSPLRPSFQGEGNAREWIVRGSALCWTCRSTGEAVPLHLTGQQAINRPSATCRTGILPQAQRLSHPEILEVFYISNKVGHLGLESAMVWC